MTKLCKIESYACVTCKIIYSFLIVNIFTTKKHYKSYKNCTVFPFLAIRIEKCILLDRV